MSEHGPMLLGYATRMLHDRGLALNVLLAADSTTVAREEGCRGGFGACTDALIEGPR